MNKHCAARRRAPTRYAASCPGGAWRGFSKGIATTDTIIQRDLQTVEGRIAELTAELRQPAGEHDRLILRLTDLEGADDRRFVPVR